MAIVAEKLYAGSRGRLAENFALFDKIRIFLRIIYVDQFSFWVASKLRGGDAPSLVPFLAHLS